MKWNGLMHSYATLCRSPQLLKQRVFSRFLYYDIHIHIEATGLVHKFIYLTHYVQRQAQRARTRCWLEWAPHSASTRSVLSTTYSTPGTLVSEGRGVSFVYFSFSFWVPLSQLKHHPETTPKHWVWLLDPLDQKLPTLFSWPQAVPAPFSPFRSCSNFHISFCTSYFWSFRSNTQFHILSLCFSESSASWVKQISFLCIFLISATNSSTSVEKAVMMAFGTGPPRMAGEGDWPGSRKGIGTRIGALLNLARNFSFLSLSLLLLWGLLYLKPP